jgi:hypothetical protein
MPPHFVYGLFNVWVCVIGAEKSLEKKMGEVLSAQGKEMSDIKANLAALSTQMAAMMEEVKKNRSFFICCPLAEPHYRLVVHVLFRQFSRCSSG